MQSPEEQEIATEMALSQVEDVLGALRVAHLALQQAADDPLPATAREGAKAAIEHVSEAIKALAAAIADSAELPEWLRRMCGAR